MKECKIALLTDSAADIRPEIAREKGIYIVPLRILCGDREYLDGVDITPADIYDRLKAGELPKTSLPSMESMAAVLGRIYEDGYDHVAAIMLSSALSGTYNLARLTAEAISRRKMDIRVFDSLSGSLGESMTVLQAAEDIANGMPWKQLVDKRIPYLIKHTYPFFSLNTLEYLQKGGRIGKVTATAGMLLNIKPVLTFNPKGELTAAAKVRGKKQVVGKLIELTREACGTHLHYNLAVANGGDPSGMEEVRASLIAALPDGVHLWDGEIDSTLSSYIGDGVLGAAVQLLDDECVKEPKVKKTKTTKENQL